MFSFGSGSSPGLGRMIATDTIVFCAAVFGLAGSGFCQVMPISKGRQLAPDALIVIEPGAQWADTFQGPIELPLVQEHQTDLDWKPNEAPKSETLLEKAKSVIFRKDIYGLEFAFKPVRMIEVSVMTPNGPERKNVWYLLYRVRYLGGDLQPVPESDKYNNLVYGKPKSVSAKWVRFFPVLQLDTFDQSGTYLDDVIPNAVRAIAIKERVGKPVYDSIQMQNLKIKLTTETEDNAVWGVATWVDVDPRTDFFAVLVRGLTNAQKIREENGKLTYLHKTLVLYFSRAGDTIDETEDRIRYGIPAVEDVSTRQKYFLDKYGQQERLDYVWTYR